MSEAGMQQNEARAAAAGQRLKRDWQTPTVEKHDVRDHVRGPNLLGGDGNGRRNPNS